MYGRVSIQRLTSYVIIVGWRKKMWLRSAIRGVAHNNVLQHTATYCNILQHTATYCNILQHTATYCNILQHTATYCNTQYSTLHHRTTQDDVAIEWLKLVGSLKL